MDKVIQVLDRVRRYLAEAGIDHGDTDSGKLRIEAGSTAVYLDVHEVDWPAGHPPPGTSPNGR